MYPVLRRGERLELRELHPTDTDAVFAIYGSEPATAHLSFEPRAATLGFALNPTSWGTGLGTETVRLLPALAFEDLAPHRVWGARSPTNEASARTMTRAGMTVEGRIREHVHKRGAWRDSVVHGMPEREWRATYDR
ncbi:GNAT family N-acetyltransferase [Streptomyces acidiscabies]|uniref:GNAT family N-acetyltransferase n=1 Tax=Streptomyces acidiscabies TaxID=42234 RepID=UPI0038F6E5E9